MESSSSIRPSLQLRALVESPLVRGLLNTNQTPKDDERSLLVTSRDKNRACLLSLKETIEALKVQLDIMTADASQLSEGLESLDMILHPVRMLPREIISHICELAIEGLQRPSLEALASPDIIDSLSMRHPSWIFAHVCRQWRHAIWNHPRCWTGVVLSFDKPMTPLKLSILLVDLMARTKELPLSIALHSRQPIPQQPMPLILQSCSRWRHATLSLTMSDFRLLEEMKHAFSELRTLQVDVHDLLPSPVLPLARLDAFSEAPCLNSLESVQDAILLMHLGWSRLRRFVHRGPAMASWTASLLFLWVTSAELVDIVLQCNSLTGLSTSYSAIRPSLRSLTIHDHHHAHSVVSQIPFFLKRIELPSLTSLTLDMDSLAPLGCDLRGGGVGPSILNLSFSVRNFGMQDSATLAHFLGYTTSLQHFALHVHGCVDLESVFSASKDAFMEPPIRSMTFTSGHCITVSGPFVSLWRKGVFKVLSICPAHYLDDEAMAALRDLVEAGLALDIRDENGSSCMRDCDEVGS